MESVHLVSARKGYGKLSAITCLVLAWFHLQAVAAFWSFSWLNALVAFVLVGLGAWCIFEMAASFFAEQRVSRRGIAL